MFVAVTLDCIGCGACEGICPQVFRINGYVIAEAYINPIPLELPKVAAKSCR